MAGQDPSTWSHPRQRADKRNILQPNEGCNGGHGQMGRTQRVSLWRRLRARWELEPHKRRIATRIPTACWDKASESAGTGPHQKPLTPANHSPNPSAATWGERATPTNAGTPARQKLCRPQPGFAPWPTHQLPTDKMIPPCLQKTRSPTTRPAARPPHRQETRQRAPRAKLQPTDLKPVANHRQDYDRAHVNHQRPPPYRNPHP